MKKTMLCSYHYDPLDRLTGTKPALQLGSLRFYCQSRIATEIQGSTQHSILQHGDHLLAQQTHKADQYVSTLLATDLQGSVLQTTNGAEQQIIAFSPFGHHRNERTNTVLLGFNGERTDPVTGNYLLGNGYRAFNPVLMRFNSPDRFSPFSNGGTNQYSYCGNNPINFNDPSGAISITAMKNFLITNLNKPYKSVNQKIFQEFGPPSESAWRRRNPRFTAIELLNQRRQSTPSLIQFNENLDPRKADTLIAFHGANSRHHSSLISGLDLDKRVPRYGNIEGPGLYSSPFFETADRYAFPKSNGVIGVYTKNYNSLKRGRDIEFSAIEGTIKPNNIQLIIRGSAYDRVHIKPLNSGDKVVMPWSHEAPF